MTAVKSLFKNRNVVYELTRKSVKSQYRNSFLGMLWSVLNPVLNMLVMWVVFSQVFGRERFFHIYLLCGNIIMGFLSSATKGSLTSIVSGAGLIKKTNIDKYLFPLSTNLSAFVNFLFSFCALLIITLITGLVQGVQLIGYQIVFVIFMLPALMIFLYGISLFLCSLYVFCRDIKHLYSVFLTLWTYVTPIFYKIDRINKESFAYTIIKLNPMYYFVRYFRDCVYYLQCTTPQVPEFKTLLFLYIFAFISIAIGSAVYSGTKKHFISYI